MNRAKAFVYSVLALICSFAVSSYGGVSVTANRYDNARTGANVQETILTPTNVNKVQFQKLFSYQVDGDIYAQPLVVSSLSINGALRNVVFVVTTNNVVYAFDADTKQSANHGLIWQRTLKNSNDCITPISQAPSQADANSWIYANLSKSPQILVCPPQPGDAQLPTAGGFQGNIGIVGTPVIDRGRGRIYFVVRTKEGPASPGNCKLLGDATAIAHCHQYLYALDISSGADISSVGTLGMSAVEITVAASQSLSNIPFDPMIQNQRVGLALAGAQNNRIIVAWSSHNDGEYPATANPHGWVMAYDADTLAQSMIFCTTCATSHQGGGAIWQSGRAPVVDASGNIYFFTANGYPDTGENAGGIRQENPYARISNSTNNVPTYAAPCIATSSNLMTSATNYYTTKYSTSTLVNYYGTSLVKLNASSNAVGTTPLAYWRPDNWDCLEVHDMDLGGSGPMLITQGSLSELVGGGKDGNLYVLAPTTSGFNLGDKCHIFQPGNNILSCTSLDTTVQPQVEINGNDPNHYLDSPDHHVMSGPVYWVSASNGPLLFVAAEADTLRSYKVDLSQPYGNVLQPMAKAPSKTTNGGHPGGNLTLSANGGINGIVWVYSTFPGAGDAFSQRFQGILRAFNADDVTQEIWNSEMCSFRDHVGKFAKFNPPTVANGKVYVPTFSNMLVVYGIGPRTQCISPLNSNYLLGT